MEDIINPNSVGIVQHTRRGSVCAGIMRWAVRAILWHMLPLTDWLIDWAYWCTDISHVTEVLITLFCVNKMQKTYSFLILPSSTNFNGKENLWLI